MPYSSALVAGPPGLVEETWNHGVLLLNGTRQSTISIVLMISSISYAKRDTNFRSLDMFPSRDTKTVSYPLTLRFKAGNVYLDYMVLLIMFAI